MNIEKSKDGGRLTLKVAGRLDTNTSPELESELKFDGVSEAVFDFSGLGGTMKIVHPNAMVLGVLEITGLNSVFAVEA